MSLGISHPLSISSVPKSAAKESITEVIMKSLISLKSVFAWLSAIVVPSVVWVGMSQTHVAVEISNKEAGQKIEVGQGRRLDLKAGNQRSQQNPSSSNLISHRMGEHLPSSNCNPKLKSCPIPELSD
jgi:hypothetical protein